MTKEAAENIVKEFLSQTSGKTPGEILLTDRIFDLGVKPRTGLSTSLALSLEADLNINYETTTVEDVVNQAIKPPKSFREILDSL